MKTIVSINGKGGCGKSTLASNVAAGYARLGFRTLLLDMDPGSEMSEWFAKGNGIDTRNTIVTVLQGTQRIQEVVQQTHLPNLSFIGSARALEHVTAQAENEEGYETHLARHLVSLRDDFDVVVIDAPNNISPAQNMTIFVADLFLVPFKDPSSVKRYPGVFQQMHRLRPNRDFKLLHVLTGLTNQPGLRGEVATMADRHGFAKSKTEVRYCGYLAKVGLNGGSIFEYRPASNGAEDMAALVDETRGVLGLTAPPADDRPVPHDKQLITIPHYG